MTPIATAVAERFAGPLIRKVVAANAVAEPLLNDDWYEPLSELCGEVKDGVEKITAAAVFAHLKVPSEQRVSVSKRLSALMQAIGWSLARIRTVGVGGATAAVRGYERRPLKLAAEPEPTVSLPAITTDVVALRGTVVQLDQPAGKELTTDLARNIEGALADQDLASRHRLTEEGWAQLAANITLHQMVEAELARRLRYGTAPREAAQIFSAEAPAVLHAIMHDKQVAASSRIEAAKGLQKTAESTAPGAGSSDRFVISLNFGGGIHHKIQVDSPQPPRAPISETEHPQADIQQLLALDDVTKLDGPENAG